ncbi:MAG TPA: hypothetical protein VMU01_06835 [Rhizomicrobium sp.]|nr:hypothetical protein [Rhizomicrobium sp.]
MSTATVMQEPGLSGTSRRPPVAFGLWLLKTLALWATIIVASAVAAKLVGHLPPSPRQDGPLTTMQSVFAANGGIALVLSLLASRLRVRWAEMALVLFVAFFCLSVGMMMIEALYFNDAVKMPMDELWAWGAVGVITAAVTGIAGALLFRPGDAPAAPVPANVFWRLVWLTLIYVVLYYTAGFFIAWQSAAVRAYYSTMNIPFLPTVGLQLFRGFLWALISLFIVTRMKGSLASRAFVVAGLFAVVTAIQLLYPNAMMPWDVRQMHLVEVGSSELVYGFLAVFVLLGGGARKPLSPTSPWRVIAGRA